MPPTHRTQRPEESNIPFDVTQEIDPAFAELLRQSPDPTLTDDDFARLAPDFGHRER